jgi:dihydrofolate reductase
LLLGRKTYEGFASSWGTRTNEDDPFADRINSMPKVRRVHHVARDHLERQPA